MRTNLSSLPSSRTLGRLNSFSSSSLNYTYNIEIYHTNNSANYWKKNYMIHAYICSHISAKYIYTRIYIFRILNNILSIILISRLHNHRYIFLIFVLILTLYLSLVVQMDFEGYYDFYNGKLNATLYSFEKMLFISHFRLLGILCVFGMIQLLLLYW